MLDQPTRTRRHSPRTVQVVALIGAASSSFSFTVLSAALAEIAVDLDSSVSTITWVIAAPMLAFAVFTPMAGKLGDVYGHRRMYLIGFTGAAVFSFATASAWSAPALIAFRVIGQGFSSSTGPSALAIIMSVYPEDRRTHVIGVWSAVMSASPAFGVVIGGPLIDLTSWRILFVLQGIGMTVAVLASWFVLPATERRHDLRFDLPGALFLAIGIAPLLIAVNRAAAAGWTHPLVILGLLISPVGIAAFAWWERRTPHPLFELAALRERNIGLPLATQLFSNGPYMAALVLTAVMLASLFDLDTTAVSLMILPRPVCFSIGSANSGRLVDRFGGRAVVALGMGCVTFGITLIGFGALWDSLLLVGVGVALTGGGSGMSRPPVVAALTTAMGSRDLGVGTGMRYGAAQVGAAAGISVLAAQVGTDSGATRYFMVLLATAACAGAGLAVASSIRFAVATRPTPTAAAPGAPFSSVLHPRATRPRD